MLPLAAGDVAEICHDLVATPSEYGEEAMLADRVEERVRALGVRHERIGDAIVCRSGAADASDADTVALVGHLDTVPNWAGGTVERTADRIVGRGAADMKGGVAVMLRLLERLADAPTPVVYVFYDREEGPNADNGIHEVLRRSRLLGLPGFAIVLEPTGGTVHAGAVGVLNADVVYRGRNAHSARPWEGENAVTKAAGALARFAARGERPVDVDGLRFHDTICVTGAHGGLARNVVPHELVLWVNVRVAPGGSLDDARAEVAELAGPDAELRWLDESPPAAPNLEAPAIRRFLAQTGLPVHPKQAWTDVATLAAAGIPALNYGPGEPSQAHQPGEWVEIARLRECEGVLAGLLAAP